MAAEAAAREAAAAGPDERSQAEREAARKEWGQVRKLAREAFLAKSDWRGILNEYRDKDGFYTAAERAKMCSDYADELVMKQFR